MKPDIMAFANVPTGRYFRFATSDNRPHGAVLLRLSGRLYHDGAATRTTAGLVKCYVFPDHDCYAHASPYDNRPTNPKGTLGHGWTCGVCSRLLQVG